MKTTTKQPSKKQRLKLMLLSGKKLIRGKVDSMLNVTNSPELISQLRKEGMDIRTEKIPKKTEKGWHGRYSWNKPKKVSRIATRAYMNQ